MAPSSHLYDDDLPDLGSIILTHRRENMHSKPQLRRSPRKSSQAPNAEGTSTSATSNQRRLSPAKQPSSQRSPLKALPQARAANSLFDQVPVLPRKAGQTFPQFKQDSVPPLRVDSLLLSLSNMQVRSSTSETDSMQSRNSRPKSRTEKLLVTDAIEVPLIAATAPSRSRRNNTTYRARPFVLDEATCDEDLVDSDAQDEGEDEDTDLSGFIVDDDAELSYHSSSEEVDSEEERRALRKAEKTERTKPRRRLQRGRRKVVESENEGEGDEADALSNALGGLRLEGNTDAPGQNAAIEVIDLTSPSPEHKLPKREVETEPSPRKVSVGTNLFEKLQSLKLSPPSDSRSIEVLSRSLQDSMPSLADSGDEGKVESKDRLTTPPATPPRSPTKRKSPSKLNMSPSKRGDGVQRPPPRQSTDAFWDLDEVNTWNDQFSPKKAPVASPRKNRLAAVLDLWSDGEAEEEKEEEKTEDGDDNDSFEAIPETSNSLPSPCESPTKPKAKPLSRPGGTTSPVKLEIQRLRAEKKAQTAAKAHFDSIKEKMALDLLTALDENVTSGQISRLAQSTGGVQITWSKTLRSTAGRANWRRTVTKPSGSPVKGAKDESAPGVTVQHFASIELAVKIIDRADRLVSTLAHEFCHLANFMVSGVRDRPHGPEFQAWARKVTKWMKAQSHRPEWAAVEVTTKHGYVIEWKYLWVCAGRAQLEQRGGGGAFVARLLGTAGDEPGEEDHGCGAEYGRHSKSIDTEHHRCGRCKGVLVQVRPKPRLSSPVKKSTAGANLRKRSPVKKGPSGGRDNGAGGLDSMVEVIELSD